MSPTAPPATVTDLPPPARRIPSTLKFKAVAHTLRPPRQVCPLCAHDDDVTMVVLGPGMWNYTCTGHTHPDPFQWQSSSSSASTAERELLGGKSEALGLYDDLPACLVPGEAWVEYGVVEWRYSQRNPRIYQQLLDDYGHTRIAPKQYTASAFIASALGRLQDAGILGHHVAEATGYWSYNGVISYWALPPLPPTSNLRTWAAYAAAEGLDPDA